MLWVDIEGMDVKGGEVRGTLGGNVVHITSPLALGIVLSLRLSIPYLLIIYFRMSTCLSISTRPSKNVTPNKVDGWVFFGQPDFCHR